MKISGSMFLGDDILCFAYLGSRTLRVSSETIQQLMEIGYVAAGAGMSAQAERIFLGVQAARPNSELPQIGRAVVCMNSQRHHDAVRLLRDALQKNAESDLAMSFLGLALKLAGYARESDSVLQQVVDVNRQPEAVAMARSLLGTKS